MRYEKKKKIKEQKLKEYFEGKLKGRVLQGLKERAHLQQERCHMLQPGSRGKVASVFSLLKILLIRILALEMKKKI